MSFQGRAGHFGIGRSIAAFGYGESLLSPVFTAGACLFTTIAGPSLAVGEVLPGAYASALLACSAGLAAEVVPVCALAAGVLVLGGGAADLHEPAPALAALTPSAAGSACVVAPVGFTSSCPASSAATVVVTPGAAAVCFTTGAIVGEVVEC